MVKETTEDFHIPEGVTWITDEIAVCMETKAIYCTKDLSFESQEDMQAWMATIYDAWCAQGYDPKDCPVQETTNG